MIKEYLTNKQQFLEAELNRAKLEQEYHLKEYMDTVNRLAEAKDRLERFKAEFECLKL